MGRERSGLKTQIKTLTGFSPQASWPFKTPSKRHPWEDTRKSLSSLGFVSTAQAGLWEYAGLWQG